jgi:hypothetical protein
VFATKGDETPAQGLKLAEGKVKLSNALRKKSGGGVQKMDKGGEKDSASWSLS